MTKPVVRALIAGAALALIGCGGGDSDQATVSISQTYEPQRPFGIEGSSPDVIVRGPQGIALRTNTGQYVETERPELLRGDLPAGSYEIVARQRMCGAAACGPGLAPGPVGMSCERSVEVAGGETSAFLVRVKPTGHGSCQIEDA